MHNDSILKVSENTLITKPLMASKKPRYRFLKKPWFGFLTVTETALKLIMHPMQ